MLAAAGGGGADWYTQFSQSVANISQSAASGGFGVNQAGGQALQKAIRDLQSHVADALAQQHFLTQQLPLGTSPAAQVYKPFFASVAGDPAQGAVPVWTKLKQDLEDAYTAISKAMQNYANTEQNNQSNLT